MFSGLKKRIKQRVQRRRVQAEEDARQRVAACEQEVNAAIRPILSKYNCQLVVVQANINGAPGPTSIRVAPLPPKGRTRG